MDKIHKFAKIKNLGLFDYYTPKGNVGFEDLTVIFGRNGSGKSTLNAIFRSLKEKDGKYLFSRSRLDNEQDPVVLIRTKNENNIHFKEGFWKGGFEDLLIFDDYFVNNNVCSGTKVELDHQKNLYGFVIGSKGVKLKKRLVRIEEQIGLLKDEKGKTKDKIEDMTIGNIEFSKFLELQELDNADARIEEKKREIQSLKNANEIKAKKRLPKVGMLNFDKKRFQNQLGRNLDDIAQEAIQATEEHLTKHLNKDAEGWLEKGLDYAEEEVCPFCGEPTLKDNDLIENFKAYFSQEYRELKDELGGYKEEVSNKLSEEKIASIKTDIGKYHKLIDFWREYLSDSVDFPAYDTDRIESTIRNLRESFESLMDKKIEHPLKSIKPDDHFKEVLDRFVNLKEEIQGAHDEISQINLEINNIKSNVAEASLDDAQKELEELKNCRIKFRDNNNRYIKGYNHLCDLVEMRKSDKKDTRDELKKYSKRVLDKYQKKINSHLVKFGANFRITDTKSYHRGNRPSSRYKIKLLGKEVDPRERKESSPDFATTLSAGDKSTLAFAFFVAKLDEMNLEDKIVLLDDPVSSQDTHRKERTAEIIKHIAAEASQTVVFSHDPFFLKDILSRSNQIDQKTLKVFRKNGTSLIKEWEPEKNLRTDYVQNMESLHDFLKEGTGIGDEATLKEIEKKIRLVLEDYLWYSFPLTFNSNDTLGSMVRKIEKADQSSELGSMKEYHKDLNDINSYSCKHHHGGKSPAHESPPDPGELRGYVKRTLDFIHGNLEPTNL